MQEWLTVQFTPVEPNKYIARFLATTKDGKPTAYTLVGYAVQQQFNGVTGVPCDSRVVAMVSVRFKGLIPLCETNEYSSDAYYYHGIEAVNP